MCLKLADITKQYIDEMGIVLNDLESYLIQEHNEKKEFFSKYIDFLVTVDLGLSDDAFIKLDHYNNQVVKYWDENNINNKIKEYETVDTLRHAFGAFKADGLLGLYKAREPENWYPRVLISMKLGKKVDLLSLDEIVVVYRGASKDEYKLGIFGQSWSIDKDIAYDFAFKHYVGQVMHKNTQRVLLEGKISRDDIYYYDKSGNEKEIILKFERLINKPKILKENTI